MVYNENEEIFGITEYISDHEGFFGIIKQRFSDFQVNEISSNGKIVRLTTKNVIPIPTGELDKVSEEVETPSCFGKCEIAVLDFISGRKKLHQFKPSDFLLPSEDGNDYITSPLKVNENTTELRLDASQMDKTTRTAVHAFVKGRYDTLVSSTNIRDDQYKCIIVKKKNSCSSKPERNSWPKGLDFVHFVLYKENLETMAAISMLSSKLRMRSDSFGFAGTKDKRAKTSQLVSVFKVPPNRLAEASKPFSNKVHLGDFQFQSKALKLGNLEGNHFKIVIRQADGNDAVIEAAVRSLAERGFLNYFGSQRFGSFAVPTHHVGRAILKANWQQAVQLILSPHEKDKDDLAEAKRLWKCSSDAASALQALTPKSKNTVEGNLLFNLKKFGNNYLTAIEKIPRNMKLLYVHAYQSYVWNRVVSQRLKKYSLRVLPGDIIYRDKGEIQSDESQCDEISSSCPESSEASHNGDQNSTQNYAKKNSRIRFVSEAEVESVDIKEVLIPIPGTEILYPNNETSEWYKEIMREDDLSLDNFKNKVKTFWLGGSYRHLVSRPDSCSSSVCYYDDPQLPLFASDLEAMNGEDYARNRLLSGKHKAVLLEFSLATSSYATMALRELMKMDTSSKFQATLNAPNTDSEASPSQSERKRRLCDDADTPQSKKTNVNHPGPIE